MNVVTDFLGLRRFAWGAVQIDRHSLATINKARRMCRQSCLMPPQLTGKPDTAIPVSAAVLAKLQDFFRRHGSEQYDAVRRARYRGCQPDAKLAEPSVSKPKVFGVGLCGTGASTLQRVLESLGYAKILHPDHGFAPYLAPAQPHADWTGMRRADCVLMLTCYRTIRQR